MTNNEDLLEIIGRLQKELRETQEKLEKALKRIDELEAENKQLRERLGQNSRNSSWPSSHDKGHKPKSQRKKSSKKAGGQVGHQGYTLEFQSEPDRLEIHRPSCCQHCQGELRPELETEEIEKRQQLELPRLRYITIEHQVESVRCPNCGSVNRGEFPEGVTQPVQYGTTVKQLAVYLKQEQFIPYERVRQLLADLFELPLSTGSLQNFIVEASSAVQPVLEEIKEQIIQAEVAHADETGYYVKGQRHWLHVVSTTQATYYAPHRSRGQKATQEIGILPRFRGVLSHDFWKPYQKYPHLTHALCHAHHLRDLTAVHENSGQEWAVQMLEFLLKAKTWVAEALENGQSSLNPAQLRQLNQEYEAILKQGQEENPTPTQRAKGKSFNLLKRFAEQKQAIWQFIHHFQVPFDNNLAERDLRMMKVQQKISGCFRSPEGAAQFCELRSYLSTIRKQGLSVWEALGSLFQGSPLSPFAPPV
jgi:transposase